MIEAKHSQAFAIVCVGLTVGLLLSPRGAIADDDVTVKHILRRAQSEAELSAVREFIETLTGDARKVEPKSEGAVLPGQGSHGIDAESETNNLAQPAASTAYEAPQANLKTSGIAPRNGLVTGETNTRTPSAEPLDAAAAPTRQPYDPTAVETGASELSAVTDLPSRHDRDAEPQRDSGEKVHSDSFTVPPASTAEDPVQSETAVSAVAPEALERDTNQVKPSVATSSSEAAAQHGGSTVPSAAIVSVPPGPAPREMADISTENEADGRGPSAVHEQGGAEEKAVSDITAQALLVKKERLAKPVKDFAALPASIRNLTPDEALARAAEKQIPSVNIEVYFQRGRANLSEGTFLLLGRSDAHFPIHSLRKRAL